MRWWHVAQRSGGQDGESSMRRSCRISNGYSGKHLALLLVHHDKVTRGRVARGASRWGRLIPRWPHSQQFSSRWLPCGSQGGYGGVHSVSSQLSRGWGPWICVLAPDWSRVCFFGSIRCHGHVGSCVLACRHVSWCGSHQAHTMFCAYLSHLNSKVGKWYTISIVSASLSQWWCQIANWHYFQWCLI
jgi:hypothetical protein